MEKPEGFFQATEMPSAGWWEALWPDPAGVLAQVGVKSGMDVIDLCSGDGWFTLQIARLARFVVAIDIDPGLLEVSRHRLRDANMNNCDFIAGDAYEVARLWTQPVDFVFLANAFHGVPDKPRLAGAVKDTLKPLGTVRHRQLASARARRNNCVGRAARTANRIAHVGRNRQSMPQKSMGLNFAS